MLLSVMVLLESLKRNLFDCAAELHLLHTFHLQYYLGTNNYQSFASDQCSACCFSHVLSYPTVLDAFTPWWLLLIPWSLTRLHLVWAMVKSMWSSHWTRTQSGGQHRLRTTERTQRYQPRRQLLATRHLISRQGDSPAALRFVSAKNGRTCRR